MHNFDPSDVGNELYRYATHYPGVTLNVDINGKKCVLVQNPDDCLRILKNNHKNYKKNMTWFRQILGPSRFSEDGAEWKRRYSLTNKIFTNVNNEKLFRISASEVNHLVSEIGINRECCVDISLLRFYAARILSEYFLNADLNELDIDLINLSDLVEVATKFALAMNPSEIVLDRSVLSKLRRDALRSLSTIRNFTDTPSELLEKLLLADAAADPIILEHELLTFFTAGAESSASSLGWALYLLSKHPEITYELRKICEVHKLDNGISANILHDPLLKSVVSEVLRLFPPTPLLGRIALSSDTLSEIEVSQGDVILVSLIGMMRCSRDGTESNEFLLSRQTSITSGIHGAFSFGPRICGGKTFSIIELMSMVANIVHISDPIPIPEVKLDLQWKAQLIHRGGYPFMLKKLKG